jgi:hypothetical protein
MPHFVQQNRNKTDRDLDQDPAGVPVRTHENRGQPKPGLNAHGDSEKAKFDFAPRAIRAIKDRGHRNFRIGGLVQKK